MWCNCDCDLFLTTNALTDAPPPLDPISFISCSFQQKSRQVIFTVLGNPGSATVNGIWDLVLMLQLRHVNTYIESYATYLFP